MRPSPNGVRSRFDPETHTYYRDGYPVASVTQLLQKHGLAPGYDGVDEETLRRKAERGTLIHKEIETYIKTGEAGFSAECAAFVRLAEENGWQHMHAEQRLYGDVVCGTADIIGSVRPAGAKSNNNKYNRRFLADVKTTSALHMETVRWQLSLYAWLYAGYHDGAKYRSPLLFVVHLQPDGGRIIPVEPVPDREVARLLDCEANGTLYTPPNAVISTALLEAAVNAERAIRQAEKVKKLAEARVREVRAELQRVMEEYMVKSWENEEMKITYVAPTVRTSLDTARLKKDKPEIYSTYTRASTVGASIRITLRGGDDGE